MNENEAAEVVHQADPLLVPDPQPRKSEVEPPPPIRLTHRQIVENYDVLARKQGYLVAEGRYYRGPDERTDDPKLALKSTISVLQGYSNDYLYELVDQDIAREILKRKCNIIKLLGSQVVEMLKLAPANPALLARILAITGQNPPVCTTYLELKNWVETNCGPKLAPRTREDFFLRVRFQNTETGRCRYEQIHKRVMDHMLSHEVITRLAREAKDWHSFLATVEKYIQDNAENELEPILEPQGFDYEDYETDKVTETTVTLLERIATHERLQDILRRTQSEDVLDKLQLI